MPSSIPLRATWSPFLDVRNGYHMYVPCCGENMHGSSLAYFQPRRTTCTPSHSILDTPSQREPIICQTTMAQSNHFRFRARTFGRCSNRNTKHNAAGTSLGARFFCSTDRNQKLVTERFIKNITNDLTLIYCYHTNVFSSLSLCTTNKRNTFLYLCF